MQHFLGLSLLLLLVNTSLRAQQPSASELEHRIQLTLDRLTELDRQPAFTHDFLVADVRLDATNPRRFDNFSGDLSGRYVEVMSLLPAEQRRAVDLDGLVRKIIAEQQADGRFGKPELRFVAGEIGGEHMALLWGNGRLLVGLMTYYRETGNAAALASARYLGDFFISTAAACRRPEIVAQLEGFGAKGIICFTQYIEGLALLAAATGEERYVRAARDAYTVLPPRGTQHTHGYLSTLRGVLLLHEITGDPELLTYLTATFDDLLNSPDHTVHGAVYEYFGGHDGDHNTVHRDEGCSSADFVRLALGLYHRTGNPNYLVAGEEGLVNALYNNQYANGDFGHHRFQGGIVPAYTTGRAWWCCTMHGLRALLAVKREYSLVTTDAGAELRLLVAQTVTGPGKELKIDALEITGGRARFRLAIGRWDEGPLTVVRPRWGEDWKIANTSGAEKKLGTIAAPAPGDTFLISARLQPVFHDTDGTARAEHPATPTYGYLTYGPHLMGVNQLSFTSEPDWANQTLLPGVKASGTLSAPRLTATFRHSGYPGLQQVTLRPLGQQLYQGHPYFRIMTEYGNSIVPRSPDR